MVPQFPIEFVTACKMRATTRTPFRKAQREEEEMNCNEKWSDDDDIGWGGGAWMVPVVLFSRTEASLSIATPRVYLVAPDSSKQPLSGVGRLEFYFLTLLSSPGR